MQQKGLRLFKNSWFFPVIILLIFSSITRTFAQQPAFYKLGEEELNGIKIYDLIQDSSKNLWIASDQGIIKFDGYSFKRIPSNDLVNKSLFDLKLDYEGSVYCKNLTGPIFKVVNDSLELFFDLPDSMRSMDVRYSFDNQNALVVSAHSLLRYSSEMGIEILFEPKTLTRYNSEIVQLKDSTLLTYNLVESEFFYYKDQALHKEKIACPFDEANILPVYLQDSLVYIALDKDAVLHKDGDGLIKVAKSEKLQDGFLKRYYTDGENLWLALFSGGFKVLDRNLDPLFGDHVALKSTFISTFIKDAEGNIILGTFREGLVVIPNSDLMNYDLTDPTERVLNITTNGNNEVFLGTQSGAIYKIDSEDKLHTLMKGLQKNIELLEYVEEDNALLYDAKQPVYFDLTTGVSTEFLSGSVKDMERIKPNSYIVGTHVGLYFYSPSTQTSPREIRPLKSFDLRVYCVSMNETNGLIYAGTPKGLMVGDTLRSEMIHLNEKPLLCNDIECFGELTYVATQQEGLILFNGKKPIRQWKTEDGLLSNTVNQIKVHNGLLFLATNKGVQVIDFEGKTKSIIGKSEGLRANNIIDFEISNGRLWLVHQKGVQFIDLRKFPTIDYEPQIQISEIWVNDERVSLGQEQVFDYTNNRLRFVVTSKSLKHSSETEYQFKLDGIDSEWQIQAYEFNSMSYKSLPPGDYRFNVKSVYHGRESGLQVITFTIDPPFWNNWWFYAIVAFIFIFGTVIIFRIQFNRQRRKVQLQNELNASKLIAIQSQMNPHFIFNAINSIQDLILKGDIDNSYSYIVKFSNLVRQTLNFSSKEFIDIDEEVELLTIYLELEKLRFSGDFEFEINTENCEDIGVPPMMVQPFAENAIKHGLLHKSGSKNLVIQFKREKNLTCIIEDNGIGRKKAQEIKLRQKKAYGSFSVSAIEKRLNIMRSQYQADIGIKYIDKFEKDRAVGTTVIVDMPFKRQY